LAKSIEQAAGLNEHATDVETYIHSDIEADREVAHALASVILAGLPDVGADEHR
jgi:hypothetical protein